MKKRNLKSLNLNKKSISNFENNKLVGGTSVTLVPECGTDTCRSICTPSCFARESEVPTCNGNG